MARRKRRNNRAPSSGNYQRRGKSWAEARIERLTWFSLVLVIATISIVPENTFPNAAVPFAGATILLGSGLYQYMQHWRVSPVTWIAGSIMLVMGLYNLYMNPNADLFLPTMITFALVILFGTLTNET